jgi:hypothetical protein
MATADVNWFTFENAPFSTDWFNTAWLAALATYGVGDVVTTIALVYFVPLTTEANPAVRVAIETFGGGGFLALKLLVFYLCIAISLWGGLLDRDRLLFYGPPLILAVFGAATTVLNLALMF